MGVPTKRMPTAMKTGHDFARTPSVQTNRSVFDLSHGHKTTFDSGFLIPITLMEVIPGDTHTCRMSAIVRLTTPLKPFMDNMYLDSHFWFVPYRLVWTNFPKFMGEQDSPGDSIAFTVPQITLTATQYNLHSVQDYMGLMTALRTVGTFSHSALPIRAYKLIYTQWYRDQNLVPGVTVDTDDGPDGALTLTPYKRGKRHDYFTSCLPFLQKGTAVSLPLGTSAPVVHPGTPSLTQVSVFNTAAGALRTLQTVAGANPQNIQLVALGGEGAANQLTVNLAGATAATINDLRLAAGIQQFLERDARGGTRYKELVWSHFRVRSDDARLDRAEYLGGGSTTIMVAPIAQQTQTGLTGGTTPLGNLGGVAAGMVNGHGFTKSFTEHGIIIGIVSVRADLTYSQGLERFWSRSTRYDFPWPVLEELGEMAVLNKEIYLQGNASDSLVFGYQERYGDSRYKPSKLSGLMAPTAPGTLQIWNLSEKFTALPTLGQTFIEDQTETVLDDRVAVPTEPDWIGDFWFDWKGARPLRVWGVPGMSRL